VSAAIGWILGGATVLLLPLPVRGEAAPGSDPIDEARPDQSRFKVTLAVVAAGCAILAVLGLRAGGVVAAAVCPPLAVGLTWLQRRPVPTEPDAALALVLDLVATALRSGRPLPDALALAAPAARPDVNRTLQRVAGLLRLGADPQQAWSASARAGPLAAVAVVAVRSATSGIKLAAAFERLATDLRAERSAAAAARAHRAGIVAMAPLAACFLPSFVCLGVIPVVVGIASKALGAVP
jgi:Flp pilus assembly protein TadB